MVERVSQTRNPRKGQQLSFLLLHTSRKVFYTARNRSGIQHDILTAGTTLTEPTWKPHPCLFCVVYATLSLNVMPKLLATRTTVFPRPNLRERLEGRERDRETMLLPVMPPARGPWAYQRVGLGGGGYSSYITLAVVRRII